MEAPAVKSARYHKCGAAGCFAKTPKEFCKNHRPPPDHPRGYKPCTTCGKFSINTYCKAHSPKKQPCTYPGCMRLSFSGLCHNHKPEYMARVAEKRRLERQARREHAGPCPITCA